MSFEGAHQSAGGLAYLALVAGGKKQCLAVQALFSEKGSRFVGRQ